MPSDERIEIAERLREAAIDDGHTGRPYGEQGFQVTLRRIIGTSNPTRPTLYSRLADLMDPTCEVEAIATMDWPEGTGTTVYELSCGHSCETTRPVAPDYCPSCGARVIAGGED